jgi:2-dehydro-3-deoxygluconokinase
MSIQLKKDCQWSLVVPTSMGLRITPPAGQPIHTSSNMFMQATSAETNVANVPAYLGLPTKVLTTFVKGSPISQFIKDSLKARGFAFEGKDVVMVHVVLAFGTTVLVKLVEH